MDVGAIDVMVAQYLKERGHSVAFLAMLDDVENVTDAAVSLSSAALFVSTLQKMRVCLGIPCIRACAHGQHNLSIALRGPRWQWWRWWGDPCHVHRVSIAVMHGHRL
jgi:hypothetical protein